MGADELKFWIRKVEQLTHQHDALLAACGELLDVLGEEMDWEIVPPRLQRAWRQVELRVKQEGLS